MSQIKFLSSTESKAIDEELMSDSYGFSLDQLVELAGLSCASSICYAYPPDKYNKVLIMSGPGNNGADGIVCGRHLHHFGYDVSILLPKKKETTFYNNIILQCKKLNISFYEELDLSPKYDLIVDAFFGFSFKGPLRSPYDSIIKEVNESNIPIFSVDVPSGWDVDGKDCENGIKPEALISLTAPKKCVKNFKGKFHFLGGRFVPDDLCKKYELNLPKYEGYNQFVLLEENSS